MVISGLRPDLARELCCSAGSAGFLIRINSIVLPIQLIVFSPPQWKPLSRMSALAG
jgi:hypothetical protein